MADLWPQLVLVLLLVVANAAFAGSEMALVSLREGQLQRLESASAAGRVLARLARDPNQFLATIQIGITLAGFLASAAAAVSLAEPLEDVLGFLGGAARPASIIAVTLVLSYITLVFGELAPKRVAMQRAERWGLLTARPLSFLATATRPVVWLLSRSTDLVVRLVGADPDVQRQAVTQDELRDLVAVQPTMTVEQRRIVEGALGIAERNLGQILVPRPDVVVLDAAWSCDEALAVLVETGHTRAPVAVDRDLDQVVGSTHVLRLVRGGSDSVTTAVRELPVLPEPMKVLSALRDVQELRAQIALVVDEHGGAAGIVTVEDLLEELVGEIYDEFDPHTADVRELAGGRFAVSGRVAVRDLRVYGVELPEGDYATVAGLVLERLGRIPHRGDVVVVDGWRLTANALRGRAIAEILVDRVDDDEGASDTDESSRNA